MNLQLTEAPPAAAHPSRYSPAGVTFSNDLPVLRAAVGLTDRIDAVSLALEQERHLPSSIALAMKEAGIFGMAAMPHTWGGAEQRTTRQQALAEDGQALYERCLRALDELRAGRALLEAGGKEATGNLRASMPVLFGRLCVVPIRAIPVSRWSSTSTTATST